MKGKIIDHSFSCKSKNIVKGRKLGGAAFGLKKALMTISDELEKGNSVEVRGFGSFEVVWVEPQKRNVRNPKTGEITSSECEGYFKVRFRSGKILNEKISSKEFELKGEKE